MESLPKWVRIVMWCLFWIIINGEFGNGMTLEPSHTQDGDDSVISKSEAVNRPVLKYGSFGFAHAHHLNPDYYGGHGLEVSEAYFSNSTDGRGAQAFFRRAGRRRINFNRKAGRPQLFGFKDTCEGVNIICDQNSKFRTPDGSCNNLRNPTWGKSSSTYRRILARKRSLFPKCSKGQLGASVLPNPRLASILLTRRIGADDGSDLHNGLSIYTVIWGQVVDHDLLMTPLRQSKEGQFLDCCDHANDDASECCSIRAPKGDFFYGRNSIPSCIPFLRSKLTDPMPDGCEQTRQSNINGHKSIQDIENGNTHFLDASHVYGSTEERAKALRTLEGGMLKSSPDRTGRMWPPLTVDEESIRMEFGDTRGDVHPAFTLLATLGVRYHNKIAEQLSSLRPDWNDERLYQEARKIKIAVHQHITYTQWMDAFLGTPNNVRTNDGKLHEDFYRSGLDPSVSLIFSTAAFRLHTLVPGDLHKRDEDYRLTGKMLLREVFHQPLKLLEDSTFDDLMRGMTMQPAGEFNNIYSQEMTEMLFAEENNGAFGMDIVSLNVQRGRDHEIAGYAAYRKACSLGSVESWNDMEDLIPRNLVRRLHRTYRTPGDVDVYIAANMEGRIKGSILGPTTHCLLREQFKRTRDGDRHFYTRPSVFNQRQLSSIKKAGSLSHVLCAIADKPQELRLPRNVFQVPSRRRNPLVPCSQFSVIDLRPWANIG